MKVKMKSLTFHALACHIYLIIKCTKFVVAGSVLEHPVPSVSTEDVVHSGHKEITAEKADKILGKP